MGSFQYKLQHILGVPSQFLDEKIKLFFGSDKWIKLKYWGQDKINSGQDWIKFKLMFRIGIKQYFKSGFRIKFKIDDGIRIKLLVGELRRKPK